MGIVSRYAQQIDMDTLPPQPSLFRHWSREVKEIKELFHTRKYKTCATRCERLKITAVDPIHKTFLNFYQALCYESVGTAADIYSTNKLPLLNDAKACFDLALQSLPLPFTGAGTSITGREYSPAQTSPEYTTLNIVKRYQHASPSATNSTVSPCESTFSSKTEYSHTNDSIVTPEAHSSSASSTYSIESDADQLPDSCADSPCQKLMREFPEPSSRRNIAGKHVTMSSIEIVLESKRASTSDHKARLSQSLSSTHCLADDLVPSPLFKRLSTVEPNVVETPSKSALPLPLPSPVTPQPKANGTVELSQQDNNNRKCENTAQVKVESNAKPLPPLPFNHKPHFQKHGSRHILVPSSAIALARADAGPPQRTTAIQTLVAKFEGKPRQHSTPSSSTMTSISSPSSSAMSPHTPITPRFRMISEVFGGARTRNLPSSKQPNTPTTATTIDNEDEHDLTLLNIQLSSFRTSLLAHLKSVSARIDNVQKTQTEREQRRRQTRVE